MGVLQFLASVHRSVLPLVFPVLLGTSVAACSAAVDGNVADESGGSGGSLQGGAGGDGAGETNPSGGASAGGSTANGGTSNGADASVNGSGGAAGISGVTDAGTGPDVIPTGVPTFAAAGYSGIRVVSRDLGKTWVEKVTSGGGGDDPNLLRGIGCGNGLCVAGGGSAGATGRLITTADGKTWKEFNTGDSGISDVAYGNNIWVGVSGHYAVRSEDGYKWEVHTDKGFLGFGGILRKMTFAGGKFIAWGDGGKRVISTDGRSWQKLSSGSEWRSLTFGNGVFVAVGSNRQTSTDGITWTSAGSPGGNWVVWTGKSFVYGGSDGNVYSSADGQTWQSGKGFMVPQENVAFGAGTFVSYGATSADGIKWLSSNVPSAGITDVDFAYLQAP
jgi:hypothetical protein